MSDLSLRVILTGVDRATGPLKRILGSSRQTAAALRAAKTELRGFESQGRKLKSLDAQRAKLAALSRQMDETRKRTAYLRNQMAAAGKKGAFSREIDAATRKLKGLGRQEDTLRTKVAAAGRALREAGVDAQSHAKGMAAAEGSVAKLNKRLQRQAAINRFRTGFGRTVDGVRRGATAITIAGGTIAAPLIAMTRTAAKFERYDVILKGLTKSAEKGKAALRWIADFSAKVPPKLDGVMQAFQDLKVYGLDPMDGTLQSLVDKNAEMGGGQEKLEGIIRGVGQAWAKQKLQGEEILQLIERGVPVWDLLAKATGKNVQELQKLSSKGKLGRDTIRALIDEMGASSVGAAAEQMNAFTWMLTSLGKQWERFQLLVMQSGAFNRLKKNLRDILNHINQMAANGELEAMAARVGEGFLRFIDITERTVKALGPLVTFLGWVGSSFSAVGTAFGEAAGFVAVTIPKMVADIEAAFTGLPETFRGIGAAIVDGLKAGFREKWEALKNWVGAQTKGLLTSAKNALGIKSPSQAFALVGANIVRGLEQGINRNAAGPVKQINAITRRLQQAGAGLAIGGTTAMAAASPLPIAAAAGAGIGGDTITINITAAPGANAQDLAAEIERVLERHSRDKAARLRSALHDID